MAQNEHEDSRIEPEQVRPCWACGMLVRLYASRCRFCGEGLVNAPTLPAMVARAALTLSLADDREARGEFPHDEAVRANRGFWLTQWGWGILLAFLAIMAVLPYTARYTRPDDVSWLFAVCVAAGILHRLIVVGMNYRVPAPSALRNPQAAGEAFLRAILRRRYDYAYALLLPDARDTAARELPYRPELGLLARTCIFDTRAHFTEYWRSLTRGTAESPRRAYLYDVAVTGINERHALVEAKLALTSYRTLELMLRLLIPPLFIRYLRQHRQTVPVTKWLYKVGERWYVVSGDVFTGEDMLPKLYHDCVERLEAGELPPEHIVARAAGRGDGADAD